MTTSKSEAQAVNGIRPLQPLLVICASVTCTMDPPSYHYDAGISYFPTVVQWGDPASPRTHEPIKRR